MTRQQIENLETTVNDVIADLQCAETDDPESAQTDINEAVNKLQQVSRVLWDERIKPENQV